MENNKQDYTDGQSFPLWLWKQTYTIWIAIMSVICAVLAYYNDFTGFFIVSGVTLGGVGMMYRIYKQMQKGESS